MGNVELSNTNINEISTDTLNDVFSNADLPYPVAKNIADNIAKEQFADSGIVTLGDYFNQTIVSLFINILVFLLLFALMRIVLAFIINGIDYAWTLPQLRMADRAIAGGLGLVRGILAVFLLFMLLPAVRAMGEHRQRQSQATECQFARGIILYEHSFLFETKGRIGSCLRR